MRETNQHASSNLINVVRDTCIYYGKNPLNISCRDNGKIPVVQLDSKQRSLEGMRNIFDELNLKYAAGIVEKQAIADWSDYCFSKILNNTDALDVNKLLRELNDILQDRVYFVGHSTTAADVLIYYTIYNYMLTSSLRDKEKNCHLSRWFDHIQRNEKLRRTKQEISFSRTKLYF